MASRYRSVRDSHLPSFKKTPKKTSKKTPKKSLKKASKEIQRPESPPDKEEGGVLLPT